MPRYRLRLEYDGTPFHGWQRLPDLPSVQRTIEAAVVAGCGEAVEVIGAGRTDTGVHALGQVAHLDLAREWAPERLAGALNFHLRPHPIAVLDVSACAAGFHARFDAVRRRYLYRILARRAPPVLERERVWHVPVRLVAERMHDAAQALIGRHDFTSFRAIECQAPSPVKTLDLIHVRRSGEMIEVQIEARSFLHHQVRNIVGTLKLVGEGKAPVDHVRDVLARRDRRAAGQTAPAAGLFLVGVDYPPGS